MFCFTWANEKSAQRRRKHGALAVVRRAKNFRPAADPFPGERDGQNLISWRSSLPLPANPVWWGSMHGISSYRGNRPTNKRTNRQGRSQYTAPQLARRVINVIWSLRSSFFGHPQFLILATPMRERLRIFATHKVREYAYPSSPTWLNVKLRKKRLRVTWHLCVLRTCNITKTALYPHAGRRHGRQSLWARNDSDTFN